MRTQFQLRCDAAWAKNWELDFELSRQIRDNADGFATGTPTNLYLIRDTESDAVKIGLAVSPQARLATLQTGNAHELELVDWAPGTLALEQFFHARLAEHKLRGEWFAPADPVLVVCEMLMGAGDMRRTMKDDGERANADATVAMLCTASDVVDDYLRDRPDYCLPEPVRSEDTSKRKGSGS